MVNINNLVYVFAGYSGCIYITNGTVANFAKRIPEHITNYFYDDGSPNQLIINGAISVSRRLLFGFTGNSNIFICGYDPSNNSICIENTIDTIPAVSITSINLIQLNDRDFSCFADGRLLQNSISTSYYRRVYSGGDLLNGFSAYFTTPLFSVGSFLESRVISQIEVVFNKPLVSGAGIVVSYRKNLTDSFTSLKTIDYTTYGAIKEYITDAGIDDVKDLQVKVEIYGPTVTDNNNFNTPIIKYINLHYS
jgi:hypothetical protein